MVAERGHRVLVGDDVNSPFAASTRYEAWVTSFRLSWMGVVGRRIWGGFAAALGDRSIDWARQAQLEHFPRYASAPSVALIADERQLDVNPLEPTQAIADRAPYAVQISKFYGSPLGLLLGLHFAGFDGAVAVQQNGQAHTLTLPLPAFQDAWDPKGNHVITVLGGNPTLPGAAAGHAWWTFDLDNSFCSRFAVLFPGPLLSPFVITGQAVFTGSEDGSGAHPWPTVTWSQAFDDTTYHVLVGPPVVADGLGTPVVAADSTTKTKATIGMTSSAPFVGAVDLIAYRDGANPFGDLSPADLSRLRNTIRKWRPAKATCVGIYLVTQGRTIGWPVRIIGNGTTIGSSTVTALAGA